MLRQNEQAAEGNDDIMDYYLFQAEDDMMDPTVAELVERWDALHKEGRFSALNVRDYWRIKVPEIYSPPVSVKFGHDLCFQSAIFC